MKLQKPYRMSLFNLVVQLALLHARAKLISLRRESLRSELFKRLDDARDVRSAHFRLRIAGWCVRQFWQAERTIPEHTVTGRWQLKFKRPGREEFTA